LTNQEKLDLFSIELNYIKTPKIREWVEIALTIVPDYFFSIPASSTGKYHPQYALGEGGLVRHTQAAVGIAQELFRVEMFGFNEIEQDCITAALILHDTYKSGINHERFTVTEHPIVAVEQFNKHTELTNLLTPEQYKIIFDCIAHHMGQWTTDYRSKREVLEKPKTKIAKIAHLCDYIASRKCLEFVRGNAG
jgi:hypothetical protein